MNDDQRDRELGMGRPISRRDFLNGMALGAAGILAAPRWAAALEAGADDPEKAPGYYPPALCGLRGSHDGSFEVAHALRDSTFWDRAGPPEAVDPVYDLIVVGGGLSGLSAAHFYRKAAGKQARVLILDNHDDFGGHARRNEFRHGGRMLIGYGGSFAIDSPDPYSPAARGLVAELGIDVRRSKKVLDTQLYSSLGLGRGMFFDKETCGVDRLVPDPGPVLGGETVDVAAPTEEVWSRFYAQAPLSEAARRDLRRLYDKKDPADPLPGLSPEQKKARLARVSYADFLIKMARADPGVLPFFAARTHPLYGLGIDAVPAQDAWGLGLPGFQGMGLGHKPGRGMNHDAIPHKETEPYFFHFPDGNATLARLLVRRLIPAAVGAGSAEGLVTVRTDYARLDEEGAKVRLRLNSTVVRVRHGGGDSAASPREVEVAYVRRGKLKAVRGRRCILACWGMMIPYICPELPAKQREALAYGVKVPVVYTNVLLRTFTAFQKLGVSTLYAPGSYHSSANLDLPVSMGGYRCPRDPAEPIVLHMVRMPCSPGLPARQQHRAGRIELLGTPFALFERKIRDQLGRVLGPAGFDPARDIEAITVNRWPHGYSYQYNSLWDPFWVEGGELPCAVGRRPFGLIAIANADAGAYAYADGAIDQAHRAVREVLNLGR